MGYHVKKIRRGELGHFSKIQEEFDELTDAYEQANPVMELIELSDLIGAIEAYTLNHYDIELDDLIKMTRATQSAFMDGSRPSRESKPADRWQCLRCGEIVVETENGKRCMCGYSPSPWEKI